jgi:hypothetical protein
MAEGHSVALSGPRIATGSGPGPGTPGWVRSSWRSPRLRQGSYFPSFLEPRRRAGQALVAVAQEASVNGVSTRKVDRLVEQLGLHHMGKERVASAPACICESRPPSHGAGTLRADHLETAQASNLGEPSMLPISEETDVNKQQSLNFNARNISEFRSSVGTLSSFGDAPVLLLATIGAKSGAERTNPTMYLADEDAASRVYVTVEIGSEQLNADAEVLAEAERSRIYEVQATHYPSFADYQAKTTRAIPVVALTLDRAAA